jgi:HEAT repeat protein
VTTRLDEEAIEAAIARLYAHRRTPGYEQARSELLKEFHARVPARLAAMLAVAERCLQELNNAPQDVDRLNYGLHLLFDFFEGRRLPQIRTLVERALQNKRFRMKERYIQTLEELGDPASVPPLVNLLSLHRGSDIEDEDVRVAVLHALTAYFPSLVDPSPVLGLLSDESLRVRSAALQYVSANPVGVAVSVLAARAQDEGDPDLLVAVLDLLGQADPAEALAAAAQRLASMPVSEREIIEVLQLTVGKLRARPH